MFVFIVLVNLFDRYSREERREAVEIVLRPFLVRMVMAFRALDASPQKNLTDVRGMVRRVGIECYVPEPSCAEHIGSLTQEQLSHKFVVGFVCLERPLYV